MIEGLPVGGELLLVDDIGRLFRDRKSVISAELSGILDRLGGSAESWRRRLEKLRIGGLLRRFFGTSRERLREVGTYFGGAPPGQSGRQPHSLKRIIAKALLTRRRVENAINAYHHARLATIRATPLLFSFVERAFVRRLSLHVTNETTPSH